LPQMRPIEPIRLIVRGPGGKETLTTGDIIARHIQHTLNRTGSSNGSAIDRKRQPSGVDRSMVAKMDELTMRNDCLSGHYRLVPIDRSGIAKMDELIVKIDVITASCAMGP